ncbi:MAG: chromate efflux transporter [Nevskia sp.]|nr:chromate efflux transporter [Nevskia sp.]
MTSPDLPEVPLRRPGPRGAAEVFLQALRLGLLSFGGPVAHLAYFERTYVQRLRWLGADEYAALVALCQVLPGPASSQVGFLIGWRRAGWTGALAAWLAFTAPAALLMFACARWAPPAGGIAAGRFVHGLKLVAVAVVAQAVLSMGRRLCAERRRLAIALLAAAVVLAAGGGLQLAALLGGGVAGALLCRDGAALPADLAGYASRRAGGACLALFAILFAALPLADALSPHGLVGLAALFFRAGALVFGGGHVVLPLLRAELVPSGWISDDAFLAGYGIAQAMPGPLFAFAAYPGALAGLPAGHAAVWAAVTVIAIFLPGLLLAAAGSALWQSLLRVPALAGVLAGVNAAVVGILGAALYNPLWLSAVSRGADAAIAAVGLALLERWRVPPVAVVVAMLALSLAAAAAGL